MKIAVIGRLNFLDALQSRSFTLLCAGQTISAIGDGAFNIALAWQVLLLTHSGVAMSTVLIASSIPSVLFFLIGGVFADYFPRHLILLWSDAGRAFVVLIIATLGWLHILQLWHLIIMGILFGLVNGFFTPAYQAITPQLIEKNRLTSANALNSISREMGVLLGPLLGAGCIALSSPTWAFMFDCLTFVTSVFCLLLIRFPFQSTFADNHSMETDSSNGSTLSIRCHKILNGVVGIFADVKEGLRYVLGSSWLWITITVSSLINIGLAGALQVALPKLVYDVYGIDVWFLGVLGVASAIGSIVGILLIGQLQHLYQRGVLAYLTLFVAGIGLVLFGLPLFHLNSFLLIVASSANALIGFGIGAFGVLWTTLVQEFVPNDKLGRVFSIDWLGSLCLTPVGYALAGFLTDSLGPRGVFLFSGMMTLILVVLAICVRDIRLVK